ncbi:serine/threonine-protein kinase [Gymnodinialimonas ulvae]|uniref:serine/threonine-protein kinase n=1 Tax=Gymnodinialimonas ulvae TaxID=3126504 RepID=UPI0030AFA4D6
MEPDHITQGDELPPGATLCGGQYRIDSYLNAGGFGVTYLARDSLGRRVVIKECFPSAMCFRSNQTVCVRSQGNAVEFDAILELFEKEARALACLQHPYIVGVHQYFRDNGTAYMAMDFVEGRTLLDLIENEPGRLTPEVVKALLSQVLQALSYIHRNDILHRDISPDNILIDDDNLPVLIDFGAAREDATRVSRVLSKLQTVKDGYSPQEFYVAGSEQTYASDLYALAATFFHVITGTAPPSSQTRMGAAARDAIDPLPEQPKVDGYDVAFVAAIWQCLALFPRDRLNDAEHWQEVMDEGLRQKKLIQQAERDQSLDKTVSQLVRDFFRDFTPKAPEAAKPKPASPQTAVRIVPLHLEEEASALDPELDDAPDPQPPTALQPARPRKPRLEPIERMQLKYHRPEPTQDADPEPAAPIKSGWRALFAKPTAPATKPVNGDDRAEENA